MGAARYSPLLKIGALLFYNPRVPITIEHVFHDNYPLNDLRSALRKCIEKDDDILTQFHSREELLQRLDKAASFNACVALLEWADSG